MSTKVTKAEAQAVRDRVDVLLAQFDETDAEIIVKFIGASALMSYVAHAGTSIAAEVMAIDEAEVSPDALDRLGLTVTAMTSMLEDAEAFGHELTASAYEIVVLGSSLPLRED